LDWSLIIDLLAALP